MKVIYMVRMNINTEDQSLHVGLLKNTELYYYVAQSRQL